MSKKVAIILFVLLFILGGCLFFNMHKVYFLEQRCNEVDAKLKTLNEVAEAQTEIVEQKISNIKNLQVANDKKIKEVTNATFRQNYQMADDDVIADWNNFIADVRQRNSSRNIDQ